jgi:hypothetical protein
MRDEYVPEHGGWWAMSSDALMDMLRQVEAGESADMVYAEHFANSAVPED